MKPTVITIGYFSMSKRWVKMEPHPIALDHLGDILWLRGKPKEARHQWKMPAEASRNILFQKRMESEINTGTTGDIIFE